jgi:methionyl-tRNA formyltransferase
VGSKIVFAGSPEFAVPSLRSLLDSGHEIAAVLTQPDRPAGRGRKLRSSPVKESATALGLEILQPDSLASDDIQDQLRSIAPDIMVVVAYGLLLPQKVLDIPRAGCVNVHASVLPRWRGASPVQAAILAGDATTGVSLMQMDAGLDTGPVHALTEIPVDDCDSAAVLEARLAEVGGRLLADKLEGIIEGASVAVAQGETGATYAGRIKKSDALIDWAATAIDIDRRIRAYNPWPVAETLLDGQRLRCWCAIRRSPGAESKNLPGKIVHVDDGGIDVQTGSGVLSLTEIQLPGRKKISAAEFMRGHDLLDKTLGE